MENQSPKDKKAAASGSLPLSIAALLLGTLLSMLCLASLTWAWFTTSATGNAAKISAATYTVVAVVHDGEGLAAAQNSDGSFALTAGVPYSVELIAGGSAKNSGYCIVQLGEEVLYTQQFYSGESFRFTLISPQDSTVLFSPQWGTYSGAADIAPDAQIGTLVAPPEENPEELPSEEPTAPSSEGIDPSAEELPTEPSADSPTEESITTEAPPTEEPPLEP